MDHEAFLGDTLAKIAGEKAGIIKEGVPAFCGLQKPEAVEVFRKRAQALSAPFIELSKETQALEKIFQELTLEEGE